MPQRVRDVMTRNLVTCPATASVADVAQLMRDRDIGDVLLEEDGRLRAIVTDRDIVVRAVAEGGDPRATSVIDVCTPELVTIGPDTDVSDAVQIMRDRAIRRLPVVEGDRAVGVLTLGDVAIEREPQSALADISSVEPNN